MEDFYAEDVKNFNGDVVEKLDGIFDKIKAVLNLDVRYVKGVGPNRAQYLYKKGIFTVESALFTIPRAYENRGNIKKIAELRYGEKALVLGKIISKKEIPVSSGRVIHKLIVADDTGVVECVWFQKLAYLDTFHEDDEVAIFGEVGFFRVTPQISHPKIAKKSDISKLKVGKIVPVYSISDRFESSVVSQSIRKILEFSQRYIFSFVAPSVERKFGLMPLYEALLKIHIPEKYVKDAQEIEIAKKRIVFEEVYRTQLSLLMKRKLVKDKRAPEIFVSDSLLSLALSSLPFRLTGAQIKAIETIRKDLEGTKPMYRLLQGDVGSGKTVVAFLASLMVSAGGYQVAVMSPTEILANQLYKNFLNFGEKLGLKIALLTGSSKKSERADIYKSLRDGRLNIIVGTHALIYDDEVKFKNLGLIVIDEQHRFGVLQRLSIIEKGNEFSPHILVMTATPIPRTVALTVWGDLDITILDEFPPGKRPVPTVVYYENQRYMVEQEIERELREGGKVFVVYPLLKDSEKIDIPSAERMYSVFVEKFGSWGVELIHGRMPGQKKAEIISAFVEGRVRLLVSTTVIEVGIDVPDATLIIIEHAERFGLAQLHQLRGRVGRKDRPGRCILVIPENLSEQSRERVKIMERETDGFKIAELDLDIRGPGDILGVRQHGFSELKTEMLKDTKLISFAREVAKDFIFSGTVPENERRVIFTAFQKLLGDKANFVMSG